MEEKKFTFRAAYNWAETRDVGDGITVFSKAGTIAGSWSWSFHDGEKGNTHFISASMFRGNPYALIGTIEFNMFELTGNKEDVLYMSYNGISTDYATGVTKIEATIVGGKGKYKDASGNLKWTSINGFIEDGIGVLYLK
ncbi:MAG: hypothetical protein SFU98_16990 [Leptospiraceae bacterium]|nr:hypothetical protein [Leptospiraceae bacterium]